jgi:hypothetical protein
MTTAEDSSDLMLVRIPDNPGDAWQMAQLFWSALRVTAGD